MKRDNPDRLRRSRIFYSVLFLLLLVTGGIVLWSLQSLFLPIVIGMLSAYICLPGLNFLIRKRIPKAVAVLILFGGFIFTVFIIGQQLVDTLPNEKEKLELRVNVQYKINHLYLDFLGKEDFDSGGNVLNTLVGDDLYRALLDFNSLIGLSGEERDLFKKYIDGYNNQPPPSVTVISRFKETSQFPSRIESPGLSAAAKQASQGTASSLASGNSRISSLLDTISIWIVMPFVFLFLLIDDGKIKHFFIDLVPNRYFEMVLTTIDNVDKAIGQYLRGTLMECSLVALTFFVGLLFIGFSPKAATLIGIIAGIANAIPFLGPFIGLVVGVIYSMVVENIEPLVPYLNADNLIIGVIIVVLVVQLLDNALFAPVVLGKAVDLHPLVVILGVTGGSVIFGFTGMLFAVPTIVVLKEIISTIYKQLKAYYIIY